MLRRNLYWEEVEIGSEIPSLPKTATSQMLVKWAGASGDFNPLHYEDTFARNSGVGRPITPGQLKRAWLIQMITDWIGDSGFLRRFSCQFKAMDFPVMMKSNSSPTSDEPTNWCRGKVLDKRIENGNYIVECEVWVANADQERTTVGRAEMILPSRD